MQTNFELKDEIYLAFDGLELDLHNIFSFTGLEYSIEHCTLKLNWHLGPIDPESKKWIKDTLPKKITVEFEGVSAFEFRPRDPEIPFSEDDCLQQAGYWSGEEWCTDVLASNEEPDPDWKTAFGFRSGALIALQAERATARTHA
ncbi:MAG: hypothetical protein JF609_04675 [Verrucomicrobia bacterium]|nr:hypothetical protein [Verrucomicrobiota bacterium]